MVELFAKRKHKRRTATQSRACGGRQVVVSGEFLHITTVNFLHVQNAAATGLSSDSAYGILAGAWYTSLDSHTTTAWSEWRGGSHERVGATLVGFPLSVNRNVSFRVSRCLFLNRYLQVSVAMIMSLGTSSVVIGHANVSHDLTNSLSVVCTHARVGIHVLSCPRKKNLMHHISYVRSFPLSTGSGLLRLRADILLFLRRSLLFGDVSQRPRISVYELVAFEPISSIHGPNFQFSSPGEVFQAQGGVPLVA